MLITLINIPDNTNYSTNSVILDIKYKNGKEIEYIDFISAFKKGQNILNINLREFLNSYNTSTDNSKYYYELFKNLGYKSCITYDLCNEYLLDIEYAFDIILFFIITGNKNLNPKYLSIPSFDFL